MSLRGYPSIYNLGHRAVAEHADEIRKALFEFAWPKISRGITAGLAQWYKEQLLARQFESIA